MVGHYRIGIDHREDDEFKQREAQAARIAREIEGDAHRVQRYAKEDELDEEALYSAVIRGDSTDEPNPSAVPYNHSGFKGEMNHSRGDSDRSGPSGGRDSMRNTDNSGFRTQNSRQGRRGMGDRDRDRDRGRQGGGGANEPNWREAASSNRMNAARYHGGPGGGNQSAAPYNSSGPGKASGSSQYGPSKYSTSAGSGGSGPASSNQFSQPITRESIHSVSHSITNLLIQLLQRAMCQSVNLKQVTRLSQRATYHRNQTMIGRSTRIEEGEAKTTIQEKIHTVDALQVESLSEITSTSNVTLTEAVIHKNRSNRHLGMKWNTRNHLFNRHFLRLVRQRHNLIRKSRIRGNPK